MTKFYYPNLLRFCPNFPQIKTFGSALAAQAPAPLTYFIFALVAWYPIKYKNLFNFLCQWLPITLHFFDVWNNVFEAFFCFLACLAKLPLFSCRKPQDGNQ